MFHFTLPFFRSKPEPVPNPPRDEAGRFVSPSVRINEQLASYIKRTTPRQRRLEFEIYRAFARATARRRA